MSKTLPLRSNHGPRDAFCGDLYLPWYHSFHWHGGVHKQRAMTLHVRSRGETTEQLRKNARGQKSARQGTTERRTPTKEQTTAQSPRTKPTAPTEVHAPTPQTLLTTPPYFKKLVQAPLLHIMHYSKSWCNPRSCISHAQPSTFMALLRYSTSKRKPGRTGER